jgi:hypothetical protein
MAFFEPYDDASYLAWLDANPDGYVINAEPSGRGFVKLHRAVCDTIRNRPPFIGPSYVKICSSSLEDAERWVLDRKGIPVDRCRAYQCWPP